MEAIQVLRPMVDSDIPDVLKLNADHVELLSPLEASELADLRRWATRADVIVSDGQTAGFVLVFGPGTDYGSANYRWFGERYGTRFHYLDRIVISDRFRRRGLASAVYEVVEEAARSQGRLTLEVNIDPPNQPSLDFHRGRGYLEVAQLGEPGHRVSLMTKDISDERTSENVT
ncbi:GNAT family N-acetyltransferase [Pedococcus bigeumensis]|uniref:GNAT family N-acetyltransferase n=1 Tax=Pedococcus bigeumensis TaxID=433644 RepID=A0A502CXM6_9MICO|nr:GNAT family N-acetyltransferase [Pedococcus bigeumensis]TPG18017.1 GNAT family N-acetyltransferase [Pedococcus bigeumensis]